MTVLDLAGLVLVAARVLGREPAEVLAVLDVPAAEAALRAAAASDVPADAAGALLHGLLRLRPLPERNEAVALLAAAQLLALRGWDLDVDPAEAAAVLRARPDRAELARWLAPRLRDRQERTMTRQLDDRAQAVLALAHDEARRFGHPCLGTQHLLLGLLREDAQAVPGVTLEAVRDAVTRLLGRGHRAPADLPLAPRLRTVLRLARREARRDGSPEVTPAHLLRALRREGQGVAAQALAELRAA